MNRIKVYDLNLFIHMVEEAQELIELTRNVDPKIRLKALKQMCPCRVKADIDIFWDRVFEMVNDSDSKVRYQVLHTICDGSPNHLEFKVMDAIERFNHDTDTEIKRRAHKIMANYSRKGKWNIL